MNNRSNKHTKVLILGSGPAGYTAAIYAARAMLKPILVYGSEPGGQLNTTTDVQNYPGYSDVIQGPWLMDQMKEQAKAVGTEMIEDHIKEINLKQKPFKAINFSILFKGIVKLLVNSYKSCALAKLFKGRSPNICTTTSDATQYIQNCIFYFSTIF